MLLLLEQQLYNPNIPDKLSHTSLKLLILYSTTPANMLIEPRDSCNSAVFSPQLPRLSPSPKTHEATPSPIK